MHIRSDGVVTIRSPTDGDRAAILAGRDDESRRWLGPGDDDPRPTGAIVVDGTVVGWVDYDTDREWLQPGEVNVGYCVFAPHRGNGYATRAVSLLLEHLAAETTAHTATLMIHPDNATSLAVARRAGFEEAPSEQQSRYFKRSLDRQYL